MIDSKLPRQILCLRKEHWGRNTLFDISRRPLCVSYCWVLCSLHICLHHTCTTVPNSLFVNLFGIICIWRILYKISIYSLLYYAFSAWHVRVLLYVACKKLNTQLLLTAGGTGLQYSVWGSEKGLTGMLVNWNKDTIELRYLFSCWKFYGQPGYT